MNKSNKVMVIRVSENDLMSSKKRNKKKKYLKKQFKKYFKNVIVIEDSEFISIEQYLIND